ncbi:hypothetical protein AWW72_14205 [Acinetobacter sp. NRRL B-65365]|uniref:hypothetical protein n=1 Tax=Acinetobacter sp. NRRL B-65365 TaxID=1785092 RepID=UPI0007A010D5|nr:hypothetical protein [Acinetobacter sp. NRRL B-65365]KYQ83492.1 hypothetical protein AWW72_14205 [Acinetobacter sp. NRRL B-65365]
MENMNHPSWKGTIELENVDYQYNNNLSKIFKFSKDEFATKINVFVENNKGPNDESILNVTVTTNINKYTKEMTLQDFSNMFFRFEIIVDKV